MKRFSLIDLLALVICLLPLCYLFYMYPALPAIVPTHFGISGKPDSFNPKNHLILIECVTIGISLLTYLLMRFMVIIDPKKYNQINQSRYQKIGIGIIIFIAIIAVFMTSEASGQGFDFGKVKNALIGILFIFLGNIMYNIKPNYFAGIRTPWTLENEDNWRATHHLGGKLFVAGGIFITISRLILPLPLSTYVFIVSLAIITIIPVAYSYIYFKKHQAK